MKDTQQEHPGYSAIASSLMLSVREEIMKIRQVLWSFDGRASRLHFWLIVPLTWILVAFLRVYLEVGLDLALDEGKMPYWFVIVTTFGPFIPVAWISLAVQIKRWHDRNKSGNWIFINFIPIVGPLWTLIELGFMPGKSDDNKYDTTP
jgi:uncharacterized membrane protein YhaH (DUF805 family)